MGEQTEEERVSVMSKNIIDGLRYAYEAYCRGDIEGAVDAIDVDPDILWIEPKEFYAGGTYLGDRKSTGLNSSHSQISYAVFCLKNKKQIILGRGVRVPVILGHYDGGTHITLPIIPCAIIILPLFHLC